MIRIGEGAVARHGAGPKAALLDRCAAAGIAVPRGVLLTPADLEDVALTATRLATWPVAATVAVRSAFGVEDGATTSYAGAFRTHLHVQGDHQPELHAAIADVVASADDRAAPVARRDVLVMAMVPATRAGVAFTESDFEDDLVDAVDGPADRLVAGEVAGERTTLPKLRRFERPEVAGWRGRLARLLRDVRTVMGPGDWDVEWADDGTRCWLLQVRAITAAPARDEALTLANHREILPDLPSRFTTSVVADAAPDLFGYWRRFDRSLPAGRDFVDVVAGRPVINLSLLTDTMRILGLPTRFVTDSMGGTADVEVGLRPARLLAKAPTLVALGLDQLRAVGNGRRTVQRLAALGADPGPDLTSVVASFRQVYVELITGMFALTTAISGPLAMLDAAGVAAALHRHQRTAGTRLWADLAPLREHLAGAPSTRVILEQGALPGAADPRFTGLWDALLAAHGHRGIYESDVARPRYREDPAPLIDALLHGRDLPPTPRLPWRALLAWPLWLQAARAIRTREQLRSDAMRVFERLRLRLLDLAHDHVEAGRLPAPDALWDLGIDEIRDLDAGAVYDDAWWQIRRTELTELARTRLPDLLHRSDDLEVYRRDRRPRSDAQRLRGLGLTDGEAVGTVWLADEPGPLPVHLRDHDVILVTRGVDAGWIGVFAQVAAVVVETGGELSHGSIILRESGTPAVTNVADATTTFATGDRVHVRARAGVVERLAD